MNVKSIPIILTLFFSSAVGSLSAQENCGTQPTEEQIDFMKSIENLNIRSARTEASEVQIPVKFFIIRRSDGSGGLDPNRINSLLSGVNSLYANAGMTFFEVSSHSFVDEDSFYDLSSSEENQLAGSRDVGGVINIYVSGSLSSNSSAICGYTYFPPSASRVFLSLPCVDNEIGTTAHELGHFFTLFHTHGKTNTGTTDELVERVNCTSLGDNLCDTPADPNLSGKVVGCTYTGSDLDANGDLFMPDVNNIMSYAPNNCRNEFTNGQYDRIRNGLENGRSNLNLVFTSFTARFSFSDRVGCAPHQVEFIDETEGAIGREWTFEGGDETTSRLISPTVNYNTPGSYDVTLIAEGPGNAQIEFTRENLIVIRDVFRNSINDTINQPLTDTIPSTWKIFNEDNLITYEYAENTSFDSGGGSVFIDNYNYASETASTNDDLELTNVPLRDVRKFQVKFKYAYTTKQDGTDILSDRFAVGYKIECNNEFVELESFFGENIATSTTQSTEFVPSQPSEWSELSFDVIKQDISSFDDIRIVRPTIRTMTENGNNFYLDNVEIIPDYSLDSLEFFREGEPSENGIELRWSNPAVNESGIIIERSIDGGPFQEIDSLGRNITVYLDTNVPDGVEIVRYRAFNVNSKTKSSFSTVATIDLIVTSLVIDQESNKINVFPNPVSRGETLNLEFEKDTQIENVQLFNSAGINILNLNENKGRIKNGTRFDTDNLPVGMYYLRVLSNVNEVSSFKLIVN